MGLLIDTDVLVLADRGKVSLDLGRYAEHGRCENGVRVKCPAKIRSDPNARKVLRDK